MGARCHCAIYGRLDYISKHVSDALVAVEDRRFYRHNWVDLIAIARAAWLTLWGTRQGGSTITQQLVKNRILESGSSDPERLSRKFREIRYALALEALLSKEQILEGYLNTVDFGTSGSVLAFGVEAAARKYFGKRAKSLNLYESALLVGILNGPSRYNPDRHPKAAHDRATLVLRQMVRTGVITMPQAARALEVGPEPANEQPIRLETRYLSNWVIEELRRNGLTNKSDLPSLKIIITLNPNAQLYAERLALDRVLEKGRERNVGNASLIAMTSGGAIRAMAHKGRHGHGTYRRFVESRRQPGSAFKTFVYLAALESGLGITTRLYDGPTGRWPRNFDGKYRGWVNMETAFIHSLNAATVNLGQRTGLLRIAEIAKLCGIASSVRKVPSLVLGTSEVTQAELTAAYALIANGGRRVKPYAVEAVLGKNGQLLFERKSVIGEPVFKKSSIKAIRYLLRGSVTRGTGKSAAFTAPVYGKTGTSQDYRDAWFVGFTEYLVTSVWLGNDDNTPMDRVTGGSLPAEAFRNFNATMLVDLESQERLTPKPEMSQLDNLGNLVLSQITFGLLMLLSSGVAILGGRVVLPAFLLALISLPFIQGI